MASAPFPLVKIQPTDDGSPTLYRPDIDETYHSHRGALSESQYVFIDQGLSQLKTNKPLTVLEIGFGTGLNALLTGHFADKEEVKIDYHTLEPFPLPENIYNALSYEVPDGEVSFGALHSSRWNQPESYGKYFTMTKYEAKLEDFDVRTRVDIIFFDAFAPSRQAEVWLPANLQKCYDGLVPGGFLVTYCAQGQFKRDLKSCGFEVEILPGALGKKQMVRAHRR